MDDQVVISHPDGRRYSVRLEVFERRYRDQGFMVQGPERDKDFLADVPRPVRRAGARRKHRKTIAPKPEATDA